MRTLYIMFEGDYLDIISDLAKLNVVMSKCANRGTHQSGLNEMVFV